MRKSLHKEITLFIGLVNSLSIVAVLLITRSLKSKIAIKNRDIAYHFFARLQKIAKKYSTMSHRRATNPCLTQSTNQPEYTKTLLSARQSGPWKDPEK